MDETVRSMTDSGTVDVHIDTYDYTNAIQCKWNFSYHVMFPLLHDTSQNLGCIGILLSHAHAHYTIDQFPILFFFLIDVFRHPRDVVTCV